MSDTSTDTFSASDFVRSPLSVRGHVVAIWKPLPPDIWQALTDEEQCRRAAVRERRCAAGVVIITALLVVLLGGIGYQEQSSGRAVQFPVIGRALELPQGQPTRNGWYFDPGQQADLVAWTVAPPILGWAFVRAAWIPLVAGRGLQRRSRLIFARHLSAVYFLVYLAVLGGAVLLAVLTWISPAGNAWFRWCLWCFLFGESFFVPAVMWIRFILHGSGREVFGRFRLVGLAAYVAAIVVVPLLAMIDRL